MGDIIIMKNYHWKRDDTMNVEKLIKDLTEKNKENHEYSLQEITQIANEVLAQANYYTGRGATPIVKIAKEFGFKTYKETLHGDRSGDIRINGDTMKTYGCDKVILVNKRDELFHQRFVVAHELAHYLFEFLGNSKYEDSSAMFVDTYEKNRHETVQEKRANAFAAEIMMPRKLFIEQYRIARKEENNRMFIVLYLSRFFETSIDSIEKRIMEVS